jgi:hypothetical protein
MSEEKTVKFDYDAEQNILFSEDYWDLKTEKDVDEFLDVNVEYLEKLGKQIYIVSKIDGLRIRANVADYYGEKARERVLKYVLGYARWGTSNWGKMTVRTSSLKAKMDPFIYNSKEEATQAIIKLKESQQ